MFTTTPSALATIQRAALPEIKFPPHTSCTPMGDEVLLSDAHGNSEIVGSNNRGGYSRSIRGREFGNYATMQDAIRAAAHDGFTYAIND